MYPYKYNVSLRIFHPQADPQIFTETLGMEPSRSWRVGDERTTPKGAALKGQNRETFWCSRLSAPEDSEFPVFIPGTVAKLTQHISFFRQIRQAGGRIEFYVTLIPGGGCLGETLTHDLMTSLGQIEIDLCLDILSPRQASARTSDENSRR